MNVISGAQCRMARGLLNWSVSELAVLSGLGVSTVKRIEKEDGVLTEAQISTLEAIHQAFIGTGKVEFIDQNGVVFIDG